MTYREVLSKKKVAISISESPDMSLLGLSEEHLRDAMTEVARHLLALGARLAYGGDLRANGFSKLLFELVTRHRRDADADDNRSDVTSYLAWPVHIAIPPKELVSIVEDVRGFVDIVLLSDDGNKIFLKERLKMEPQQTRDEMWSNGLTNMRRAMLAETNARIVLGGKVTQFKGSMPGIAEEALLSLQARQPLYLMGGFGGCARDIAEIIGLGAESSTVRREWPRIGEFNGFTYKSLNNGLTIEENTVLARTPHTDQAIQLILRGMLNVAKQKTTDEHMG